MFDSIVLICGKGVDDSMAGKPNLLYVFADQLRRNACGYTGYRNAQTPNIDALQRESLEFTQAVSGSPVCAPYRASLFTGKILFQYRNGDQ